jgi:hypothetical protein
VAAGQRYESRRPSIACRASARNYIVADCAVRSIILLGTPLKWLVSKHLALEAIISRLHQQRLRAAVGSGPGFDIWLWLVTDDGPTSGRAPLPIPVLRIRQMTSRTGVWRGCTLIFVSTRRRSGRRDGSDELRLMRCDPPVSSGL